jgi:ankyrin repeat protein
VAQENNNSELVQLFLKQGADPNAVNGQKETPVHVAARMDNHTATIRALLDDGARVNEGEEDGWTPLHFAVRFDHPDTVRLLLERGADPNALARANGNETMLNTPPHVSPRGLAALSDTPPYVSPLFLDTARSEKVTVAKMLLAAGARVNAQDRDGRSPLAIAVLAGRVELVRLLLRKGANTEARFRWANDPSDRKPAATALMMAALRGHSEIVKLLLEAGAQASVQDGDGDSPLLLAAQLENATVAKLLLEAGAQVNVQSRDGVSPLVSAIQTGNVELVRLLLEKGASVEARFRFTTDPPEQKPSRTALMLAAQRGNSEIVKLLLDAEQSQKKDGQQPKQKPRESGAESRKNS